MAQYIDVFSEEGSGAGVNTYQINIKCCRNELGSMETWLTSNRIITDAYPAFLRYMEKRRNGTYEEGRPNLSKWFAYQYYNFPDNVPYKDTSMFALSDNVAGTEGHHSLMTKGMALYQLLGVKNNANRTIVTDIRTTIAENFFEKESNNTWKSLLNKRNKREVTSANENINEAIIGFDKAGIALVDSQGNILSNIIRLKIVARLGYWDAQESGNVFFAPSTAASFGRLMLLYPRKDK